jgi:hypothetical protein
MKFECSHCQQRISAGEDVAGTMVTCPNCSKETRAPDLRKGNPELDRADLADQTDQADRSDDLEPGSEPPSKKAHKPKRQKPPQDSPAEPVVPPEFLDKALYWVSLFLTVILGYYLLDRFGILQQFILSPK